jgi:hypothetical protein
MVISSVIKMEFPKKTKLMEVKSVKNKPVVITKSVMTAGLFLPG